MRRLAPTLVAAALLIVPAAASADVGATIIHDCLIHGEHVTGHYTQQQYAQALAELPGDTAEYTGCADVIRQAQLAAAAGRTPGGRSGPPPATANTLATAAPAERAAVISAQRDGSHALDVGGGTVRPGIVTLRSGSVFNALPTPLLVALIALVAVGLAAGGRRAWELVRARR
jgi:hypothetical protein